MAQIKEDIKCPSCNNKMRVKRKLILSDEDIPNLVNKSIFINKCNKCNKQVLVEYPVEFENDNFSIYYDVKEIKHKYKNKICRVVYTIDDLKEKVMILNDKLNDIVIEYIKHYIISSLDNKKDLDELRYNGIQDKTITFTVLPTNDIVGIHLNIYDNVITHSKIKNKKKYLLIDEQTYKDYFKLK